VSFVLAPDPSILSKPTVFPNEASLKTVPSNESEPSGISSALNESLAECYESLDDAGRQSLMFSAMTSKDYSLLQSLFTLQKTKGTFTLPKLSGKLLEQANKQKLPILAYDKDATKRRYFWNTWFMKLRIIVGLFSSTAKFISKEGTISLFDSSSSQAIVANKAIFILVQSYVDKYYADQLHSNFNEKGDQALLYLQRSCAKQTNQNKHHFHQAFTSLTIFPNETATAFLKRFNIGRADAEKLGNVYSNVERIDFLLTAMEPCTKPAYRLILTLVQSQRNKGDEEVNYETFEQDFITVDEKEEQVSKKNRISARGLTAET